MLWGPLKSYWWIQKLAPNFSPLVTGNASWCVRGSIVFGSLDNTDGLVITEGSIQLIAYFTPRPS